MENQPLTDYIIRVVYRGGLIQSVACKGWEAVLVWITHNGQNAVGGPRNSIVQIFEAR